MINNDRFNPEKIINNNYQKQIFHNELRFISKICDVCDKNTYVDESLDTSTSILYRIKHFVLPTGQHVYLRAKQKDDYKEINLNNNTNLIISPAELSNISAAFFDTDAIQDVENLDYSYVLFNKNSVGYSNSNNAISVSYVLGTEMNKPQAITIGTESKQDIDKLVLSPEDELPECTISLLGKEQHFDYKSDSLHKLSLFDFITNRLEKNPNLNADQKSKLGTSFNDIAGIFNSFGREDLAVLSDKDIALQRNSKELDYYKNLVGELTTTVQTLEAKNKALEADLGNTKNQLAKLQQSYNSVRSFITEKCAKIPILGKYLLNQMKKMQKALPEGEKSGDLEL